MTNNEKKLLPDLQLLNQDKATTGWVLLKPIKMAQDLEQRMQKTGLVLPAGAGEKDRTGRGIVLAANDECVYVKRGQKIIFLMYAPAEVIINEDKLLAIQEKDIIGIYEGISN